MAWRVIPVQPGSPDEMPSQPGGIPQPAFPEEAIQALIRAHYSRPPAVAPPLNLNFRDRLALGLANMPAPPPTSGSGAFGAGLVSGFASGFSRPRLQDIAYRERAGEAQAKATNQQSQASLEAGVHGLEQTHADQMRGWTEAEIARRERENKTPPLTGKELEARSYAEARGRRRAEKEIPLSTAEQVQAGEWLRPLVQDSNGNNYINIEHPSLRHIAAGATQWALTNGVRPVTTKDEIQLHDIQAARENLKSRWDALANDGLDEGGTQVLPRSALDRMKQYPNIKLNKLLQKDAVTASIGAFNLEAGRLVRATTGAAGLRLNQKLIDQAVDEALWKPTDTYNSAVNRLHFVLKQLSAAERPIFGKEYKEPKDWVDPDSPAASPEHHPEIDRYLNRNGYR